MSEAPQLNSLRSCLEGVIPSVIATVSPDGIPNVTLVSQVHYVNNKHVALSFQFFNKTRENILANPYAMVQVVDPDTSAHYRIQVKYLRTETEGPLFENMKAKLAGIASHTGMAKVFRLLGADIYEVLSIGGAHCERLPCALPQRSRLTALRAALPRLNQCTELDLLFDETMAVLRQHFDVPHAILLMYDKCGEKLYTVASQGYSVSGIGAEIPLGVGVIGVAAQQQTPIRIMYMTGQYTYNRAVRESLIKDNAALEIETEIPFAGLADPHSQLAAPIILQNGLLGVLYVDSPQNLRFTYEDEDALMALADYLAMRISQFQEVNESLITQDSVATAINPTQVQSTVIRHYRANDSIFIDEEYLIKGVAGAIFWKLVKDYTEQHRTEFSNRELRLDPRLGLPELGDNLEARLILLQKRLLERCDFLRLEKTGRGRFRLQVDRAIVLEEA